MAGGRLGRRQRGPEPGGDREIELALDPDLDTARPDPPFAELEGALAVLSPRRLLDLRHGYSRRRGGGEIRGPRSARSACLYRSGDAAAPGPRRPNHR